MLLSFVCLSGRLGAWDAWLGGRMKRCGRAGEDAPFSVQRPLVVLPL